MIIIRGKSEGKIVEAKCEKSWRKDNVTFYWSAFQINHSFYWPNKVWERKSRANWFSIWNHEIGDAFNHLIQSKIIRNREIVIRVMTIITLESYIFQNYNLLQHLERQKVFLSNHTRIWSQYISTLNLDLILILH